MTIPRPQPPARRCGSLNSVAGIQGSRPSRCAACQAICRRTRSRNTPSPCTRSAKDPLSANLPRPHDIDAVGLAQGGKAVGDDNPGRCQAREVCHDLRPALVVEPVRRFVEQENARIADQRTSDRDALALAARHDGRAGAHRRQHAHRHRPDLAVDPGYPGGLPGFVGVHRFVVRNDVVPQVLRMKLHILGNRADVAAHLLDVEVPEIAPVVIHRAAGRCVRPHECPTRLQWLNIGARIC